MNDYTQYSVYVGTVRGVLAHTQCKPEESTHFELGGSEKSEITSLEWGRAENEIALGHKNGIVKLYSTLHNKYTKIVEDLEGTGAVVGIGVQEQSLIIGRHSGHVNVWSKMDLHSFSLNLQDDSTVECMVQNKNNSNVLGTGGESNDFKLWDVETKKAIFKAKSMGHDELNLPIPTSVRGLCFLSNENNLASCATKEGYVLLYDEKAQRRPVMKFIEPKASYTAISSACREKQCVVGTTKGYIQLIDLRSPAKCIRTYKSFTGSVTSIVCDPGSPIIASTSLDRHLRIHNFDTKECIYKKYMKQSLTRLLLKPVIKEEPDDETANDQIDEEYEALFENMKTIAEKPRKKRKPVEENQVEVLHKKNKKLSRISKKGSCI